MTKPRAPLSFQQAITRVVGLVGVDAAAHAVRRSPSLVQQWTDRDSGKLPNLEQAHALDVAWRVAGGEGAPILESYALQLDVLLADRFTDAFAIAKCLAVLSHEHGEAVAAALAAIQPGASPVVVNRAIAEGEQAAAAMTELLARLTSFLKSGAGPGGQQGGGTTNR